MGITASEIHLPTRKILEVSQTLLKSERSVFFAVIEKILGLFGWERYGSVVHLDRSINRLRSCPKDLQAQLEYARIIVKRAFEMKSYLPVDVVSSYILKTRLGEQYSQEIHKAVSQSLAKAASEQAIRICEETLCLPDGEQTSRALSKIICLGRWAVYANRLSSKDYQRDLKVFFEHVYKQSLTGFSSRSRNVTNIEFRELIEQFIAEELTRKTNWARIGFLGTSAAVLVAGLYDSYRYSVSGDTPVYDVLQENAGHLKEGIKNGTEIAMESMNALRNTTTTWLFGSQPGS